MTEHTTEAEAFLANRFVKFLREHDRGRFVDQAEQDLAELVEAVRKHAKKGTLKITLTVEPDDEDVEQVVAGFTTSLTAPRPASPKRAYFTTDDHGLSRHHPSQLGIQFE